MVEWERDDKPEIYISIVYARFSKVLRVSKIRQAWMSICIFTIHGFFFRK